MPLRRRGHVRRVPRRAVPLALALLTAALAAVPTGALQAAPSRAELEAAKDRLHELEREFEIVAEEYNATREELEDIQADMATTELEVDRLRDRMDVKRSAAVALASELYKSGGVNAGLDSLLTSTSMAELESRLQYLRSSERAQEQVFDRLAVDQARLDAYLAELEEDRVAAMAREERLAELRNEIDERVESQQDEIARLNREIERAEAREAAALAAAEEAAAQAAIASVEASAPPGPAPAPNRGAQTAVDAALSQVGKPYQWGAEGPDSYDCSGLTLWAWAQAGVSLPHNSGMQYDATPRVARSDWAPGDLLFFGSPIHHVAMYIGNGQMVEAPYSGAQVRVVSAFRSDYVGAGRPGV